MNEQENTSENSTLNSNNSNKNLITINTKEKNLVSYSVIETISELLTNICEDSEANENDIKNISNSSLLIFYTKKVPQIEISSYLFRLAKYSKINESTLILTLIYIDRLCKFNEISLSYYNIFKIILASFILSIKYNEDDYCSLEFYGKIGGISKKEMKTLEYEFLSLINFNLFVTEDLFDQYSDYIYSNEEEDCDEDII